MPREITTDDLADEWADKQAQRAGNCRCHGEMPGSCPGPHNCPMCINDAAEGIANEQARVEVDLILNRNKIKRADDKALRDQIMLNVLMGSSL